MKHITLSKIPGERYDPGAFKVYSVSRNGAVIGQLEQNYRGGWEVVGPDLEQVSVHTTIKAAARVAGRVL